MFLANVSLFDFRNYAELELALERSATVFFGGNAQGKTNLLEAVALSALTRSPRTQQAGELVRFGQPAARVTCGVQSEAGLNELEVRISVRWPASVPEVSSALREHVRDRVSELTGLTVTEVAISVTDLVTQLPPPPRAR